MVRFAPVEQLQMQVATGFVRKPLEEFPRQAKAKGAGHVLRFIRLADLSVGQFIQTAPDQARSPAEIDDAAGEALIHWQIGFPGKRIARVEPGAVAANPPFLPQRLEKSLPQRNAA